MKRVAMLMSCAMGVLLAGCFGPARQEDVAQEKTKGLVIVNVLDAKYHEDCHIKGSINVPIENLVEYADKHWDKDETQIVLYCGNYMCTASGAGAHELKGRGFKHVWAYEGGTAEWKHKGLPTEGICESGFLKSYEAPEGYAEKAAAEADIIITAEDLQKKIAEFATK